jgi:hypothetical protein
MSFSIGVVDESRRGQFSRVRGGMNLATNAYGAFFSARSLARRFEY